jgi:hypothetical protein
MGFVLNNEKAGVEGNRFALLICNGSFQYFPRSTTKGSKNWSRQSLTCGHQRLKRVQKLLALRSPDNSRPGI